jgi:hypothetical protein
MQASAAWRAARLLHIELGAALNSSFWSDVAQQRHTTQVGGKVESGM